MGARHRRRDRCACHRRRRKINRTRYASAGYPRFRRAEGRGLWEGRPRRTGPAIAVVGVALASAAIKAIGPILVGGKDLSPSTGAVIALLAPALLTALVVTETFGEGGYLVLDEKAVGAAVAALALALRAPVLLAVALAALTTTLVRALA